LGGPAADQHLRRGGQAADRGGDGEPDRADQEQPAPADQVDQADGEGDRFEFGIQVSVAGLASFVPAADK
jgi:hypothetical protein